MKESLKKSTKIESEIEEFDLWVSQKITEIPDTESIIITEEQLEQIVFKYKVRFYKSCIKILKRLLKLLI